MKSPEEAFSAVAGRLCGEGGCDLPATHTGQHRAAETPIHACPQGGDALMPCCEKTPFEVPRDHRMTLDPALVTCKPEYEPDEQDVDWARDAMDRLEGRRP